MWGRYGLIGVNSPPANGLFNSMQNWRVGLAHWHVLYRASFDNQNHLRLEGWQKALPFVILFESGQVHAINIITHCGVQGA